MRAMRRSRSRPWFVDGAATALLALLCACGGSGGAAPGSGPTGPTVLARLAAALLGSTPTTVVDPAARGLALLEVSDDGQVRFGVTGEPSWVGSVVGLALHQGAPGTDGPVVLELLAAGGGFDAATATTQGSASLDSATAAALAASPGGYYVRVATTGAPAGLVRGSLAAFAGLEWHALLDDGGTVPPNTSGASGAASLRVLPDLSLRWVVALAAPPVAALTAAHVAPGGPGVPGAALLPLDFGDAALDAGAGTVRGTETPALGTLSRLGLAPQAFHVACVTASFPGGIVRGQLSTAAEELWALLEGSEELLPVSPFARGAVGLRLSGLTQGQASFAVPVAQSVSAVSEATIREGVAGATGPAALDLRAGADFGASESTGSGEGTVTYDQLLYARLLADPSRFHAQFRTAAAPAGLCRGQLTRVPPTFVAQLAGSNEVPPALPSGTGKLQTVLTGLQACTWTLRMTSPPGASITALHVHDGAAGLEGPVLIDLDAAGATLSGDVLSGQATFTGRTFVRLLADPAAFYGNAHTAALPDGAVRGQMFHLTQDSPPAGLVYASPVTYVTGQAIAPNVPDSVGGAVTGYGVTPALPAGLALDPLTGILSGTPTVITAQATWTVTASNASGSASTALVLQVDEGPPLTLAYATPVIYVVGTAITPNAPTVTGGAVTSWSVSPALPAGLSLDAVTGVISGTPTAAAAATDHTVTAANGAGNVTALVNVRVDAALTAPSGLSYTTPVTYVTGAAITANQPTVGGGAVSSWSVSPTLPAGLSLDPATGVISGTPTAVTATATYTVTAANAAGSTQATLSVTVDLGPPAGLSYDNDPAIGYVIGGTFPTMSPSSTGGAVASYSITPALPAGLTLHTTTGVISGAPTTTSAQTTYTVTATNAAGSTTATVTITVLQ